MKRVINFVKGRRDDRRDHKFVNSPICVEITNPAGQKIQSEDEHILGLQSGYGYQIDINGKDKNMTKLHKAAWQGNVDKVKINLKKADVNSVDHSNRTALHLAVAQGHSNVASLLLGAKALFDLRDSDGITPFLKAVECGNKECVNMLLEQGADVNIVDRNGNTGLHLSSKLGFLNISSLLLMKGANINISNNVGEFPLHLATEGEHRELVALLLCSGAQVNVIDRDNRTPLMLAARFGHASLVSLFLEHGASLEACDSNGWTAEDYALIGGHQQLALDLKAPAREQLCKEMEQAVVNGNSSDETKEEKTADDCGKDVCSDESEANQPAIVHETAVVQINSQLIESNNGNNDFHDRTIQEEEDDIEIANEEKENKKEEGETVESPRSCVTPPPLQPPRSWDLIQAGMIDEKEVQRRSLTTLGTLRSRRESFNENSNNNINNNGGSSPNQANDDLEKITDIVKTVQMEGLVDDESSDGEENLPLDRAASVRRVKATPLERTPSLDLTLTEDDLTKSKESQGCPASSDGGTLGREDTLQGYEEVWEKNANISEVVDNIASENNNKLQSVVNDESNEVFDTGQLTITDISEQLVQRNREINTAVGYVTNEIYRIMVEKNEYQSDGADKVINQTVHTSSSLDNLDERKQRFIDIESSRSCDNLDNRYMTLEEKLCSGIYSAETLDTEPSINENEGTQSLDNLDESPVGTVIKRNMHREVQSLDTLDDYDQCCSRGCVEARPIKKHSRNKSVSVGQHGWSKSVDVLTKPSNIDRIQIDTKKIDAQLECYDEALRELAQDELMKRNSLERSSGESSSGKRNGANSVKDKKPCFPPPPPVLTGDIPYFSEIVSSSSQKSREYFMKPKDESDFSINQDFSPLPKVLDKCASVDGLLDSDRNSTSVENTSINGSFKSDSRFNHAENDSLFNHDLPPPPPPPPIAPVSNLHNEIFETDLYLNLENLPGDLENENVVITGKINGIKQKNDDDDSESKRAREVENNLYKLEKDLFNINMSAIMKPRAATDVNQNGIVHQDIVVANGEMPPFDMRSKVFEKSVKQTSFAVLDEARRSRVVKRGEDSSSPVDRSAGEDSPKVPPRYKRSLRKGKSESEVWKITDGKTGKSRSKSASMYSEVEALFEKPSKGRKKSSGSGEIQEKSESDSELCERPLRRKRKMLLAMRGVVAGSKDSEDDDDTSTGDPPFWLSTDKGGHFARQDTVLATQPTRILEKSQDPPGCARASQSSEKPPDLDKDWTSSDADTASGSDEVVVGNAFSLGSHQKLLKEHLRQATNEKTVLEEAVAVLREREERLQYELADARQALSAREDTVLILQEQARRIENRYSSVLDEVQTLRHCVSSSELELKHLRELCDKLAMEKADALNELNQFRDNTNTEQIVRADRKKISCELKPEQMLLQRQKLEAERRSEVLVNHLEEAMRQCECAKSEKDALARQNVTDIKKLQQDTLLWKERYEDCLGRLERIEAQCQPRLFEAQRTIEILRTSIKQLESERELNQDNWKSKDEAISRIKRAQNSNNLVPKPSHDKKSACLGNCMRRQSDMIPNDGFKNKKYTYAQNDSTSAQNDFRMPRSCNCTGVSNSTSTKVYDGKLNCSDKLCCIYNPQRKNISNDLDKDYLSKLSLLLDHNRKLVENLFIAKKEKDFIKNELSVIRRNIECDLQRPDYSNDHCPNESCSDKDSIKELDNQSDLMKVERKHYCLSKVKSILSKEEDAIEGILRSIKEVEKDLESIMNNLHRQIVLAKTLNQCENNEPENQLNEVSCRNSTRKYSSNGKTYPNDRREMSHLVIELVDIRRDLSHLHSESERVSKLLESVLKQKRNGDAMSDELKTTTESVQSCSNEILKLNAEVLKLHNIIQTLMIEFTKNKNNEKNVLNENNPDSNQNGFSNSSKQTDMLSKKVYGQKCSKLCDERNGDPSLCQESIIPIKSRSNLKSEMNGEKNNVSSEQNLCSNRKIAEDDNYSIEYKIQLSNSNNGFAKSNEQCNNDNAEACTGKKLSDVENASTNEQNTKCELVISGGNSTQISITHDYSYKNTSWKLRNSQKFHEVRQKCENNSTENVHLSEAPYSNNAEAIRQELGQKLPARVSKICHSQVFGNNKYSEELLIVLDVEGARTTTNNMDSILSQISDQSLVVETSEGAVGGGVMPQEVENDPNFYLHYEATEIDYDCHPKLPEIVGQTSSHDIIYLKKALTTNSNESEMSQDNLEKLVTDSEITCEENTTNSYYESVGEQGTELLDPLSSCQTVTVEPGYMSEPSTSIKRNNQYCESYPSSNNFGDKNYSKNITTESLPGCLKPCEKNQKAIGEEKLGKNYCSSDERIEENELESNQISEVSCQNRQKKLDSEEESIFTTSHSSLARHESVDNVGKSSDELKQTDSSNDENSSIMHSKTTSNQESKCTNTDQTEPNDQLEAKTRDRSCSSDLNNDLNRDDIMKQSKADSEGIVAPQGVCRDNHYNECGTLKNLNVQQSNVSVSVQTRQKKLDSEEESIFTTSHSSLACHESVDNVGKSSDGLKQTDSSDDENSSIMHSKTTSNQESKCTNTDQTEPNDQLEAKTRDRSCSSDLNRVDDIMKQSNADSEGIVAPQGVCRDNHYNECGTLKNLNVQQSNVSVSVQTKESIKNIEGIGYLEECGTASGILQSSESKCTSNVMQVKPPVPIRKINIKTEFLINNGTSDQNISEINNKSDLPKSTCTNTDKTMANNPNLEEAKASDCCSSSKLNSVDNTLQQSKTDSERVVSPEIDSQENEYNCGALKSLNVQQQYKSVAVQTKESLCDLEEGGTSSASGISQSSEGAVEKRLITKRKIIRRTEYLINNDSTSELQNSSRTIQPQSCESNSELKQSSSCSVCTLNDKSKKSCFKHLCLKRQNSANSRSNDRQINFLFENLDFDPNIYSGKAAFSKLLPVEQSLGLFFKSNLSDGYSLDDFESNLRLNDWRLNPFLEQRMTKELFDGYISSDIPLDEENKLSHIQIYADLKRPILLPRINLPSITCKADKSEDVITDIGQKLSAVQPTVDYNLQAAASASNLINQEDDDDAICLDFQQVENLECPDSFETTKIGIVNDVNRTSNGFQECQLQPVSKATLSRERQEEAVGRIRQQALLESENNLSAKIAEINSVLHQQLVEQDRRRAHNEMQMKKEFELTRQKLLMELSKVQTALKAKEAEERVLRDKYEKLSRDVEKTAEIKRKQLIEKSYSLNLAHPSTMWEKELSIKRNVVQPPLPPPPPPPPLPPPDLPCSFTTDGRFSHLSLRAQLHQSITKHRTNPRNPSDQVNLATNCNSQFEEVATGSNSENSVAASTSNNIKR